MKNDFKRNKKLDMNLWRLPETFYVDEMNESPNHCPLNVEDVISIVTRWEEVVSEPDAREKG